MGYQTTVTEIGPMVQEFIDEKMIIVFNDNAPAALREMAVLHTIEEMEHDIKVDDIIVIGDKEYLVTAVGSEANETLKMMGHCTFCFNGGDTAKIPGQIELLGESMPEITLGCTIEIIHT
ncbi:MAG: PTS glucitol/sorbitol transporter subunit IIA [Eubacterium sp.]